jgi:hypothetical protein
VTGADCQRFLVLFFIDLATRRVEIAGITAVANQLGVNQTGRKPDPHGGWRDA